MINDLKRKKRIIAFLLFLLSVVFSHGQDTIVKKKYLDSVKNQLAIYKVSSYTHLNMYDKSETEKKKLFLKLEKKENDYDYLFARRRRENLKYVGVIFGIMIMSFVMITKFK